MLRDQAVAWSERDLSRDWDLARGTSSLDWDRAKHATRDAWNRLSDTVECATPGGRFRDKSRKLSLVMEAH